jgi:type I restriction enzyme M protein
VPSTLPFMPADDERLDIGALETWLWDAACAIRGATDAPKFKDFILPLVFYKRLSDVFDDEFAGYITQYGDEETARAIIEADHEDALRVGRQPIVRFYLPSAYAWRELRTHPADGNLGEFVTDAMRAVARLNPPLHGVLDVKDNNERQSGQRSLDDDRLAALIEVITRHGWSCAIRSRTSWGARMNTSCVSSRRGRGRAPASSTRPKRSAGSWLSCSIRHPKPRSTIQPVAVAGY